MTWALGDNQARAFVGNIKAEKIAQGAQVIWTRVAAKNPSGVANSNTEAQLSWTDDSGIELQFIIERALDAAFAVDLTTLTVGQNQQSLIDNTLSHDTTYYYRVKGDYPAGQVSDFSDVITITTLNLVAPPTPVSATGTSNSSISLAWIDNSNNEDGFKIERSTSSTGPFTEIADLPSDATSYNDVGLTYNTTYHYRIIGYNADDTSAPAVLSATTTNDLLSPSGLTVTPISNSVIELNWQDNTVNEDGFKIARSTDGINYTDIDTVGPDVVTYTDAGLIFNTTYYYQVRGYNTSGDSNTVDGSATTTNSLSAPTNLVTTSITNTSIGLQWTDNSINEDGFTINGFDLDNGMQSIGSVNLAAGTTSYTWGSLVTDNSYSFQVIATNPSGNSSALSGSFTTTDTLSDITGFSATAASNTTISLSWTDTSNNEDGFKIARSTDGINYTDIDTLSSGTTTYTDTGLTFNTTYHYQVRSFNTSGDSNTATDSATTTNSLSAPSNLTAVPTSNTAISLSWTDTSNNEDGFTLQRATGNGAYAALADLAANTTSFSDSNLTPNYAYHYQIRGYNSDATSSFTTVTVTTLDDLTAPTITSATVVSHEQVDISFTDTNTNEDSFELEFSSDGGNTYASATNSLTSPQTSATYPHIGLTQATTYQWRIRAKNTSGVSSWSTAVSATTQSGMNAPQIISASQVNRSIQISFQDNTLIEDSFTVERSSSSSTVGFAHLAHLAANSTSYTNNYNDAAANLTAGTTYYYRVKADSSQYGDSPYSNVTAVSFNPIAATTTTTSNFVGQNDLGFDFAETTGQTMPAAGFSTFHYELATDSNFSSITKTISSPTLLASVAFSDLSPDTTYYARLRITGLLDTSAGSAGSSGAIITDPCSSASISIADDGDSTQTVTVTSARPNSLITISEYSTSSGIRGSFSTLADDEQGDPFLGIIRSAAPNGGKITVDGGMLKYVAYLPPAIVPTYGDGTSWSSHAAGIDIGGDPQWTTTEESFLAGGGSIYDSSNIPTQWSFLYNNINYLSRSTNKTNKILYINDYKNGISGPLPFPYYGAHKFYHGFKYISEHAGYTFEQLPVNTGAGNTWLHHDAIENLHSTAQQWTDYFNNYDLIIYVGVNGETNGYSSSIAYLPQAFIDGFLNFIDGGGGSYMTTDHEPIFPVAINQILSYYGIFATGNFTRTASDPAYKISSMLADQTYVPQGWHPLFSGLDVNSSILAGSTEAIIEYNTGQDTTNYPILSTTSNHTADASGNATITSHSAGVSIGYGEVFVLTADGCGSTFAADDCSEVVFNISINQSTLISTVSISNAVPGESVTIEETNSGVVTTSVLSISSAGSLVTNMHENGNNIGTGSLVITTATGCSFTSADASTDSDFDGVPDAFDSDPNNPLVFGTDADGDGVDSSLDPDDQDASVYIVTPTSEGADTKVYPMNYAVRRQVSDYSALLSSYGTNAAGTPSGSGSSYLSGGTYCTRYGTPGPRTIPLLAQGEKYCVNLLTDGTGENNAMGAFEWFDFGETSCAANSIASPVFANVVCNSGVWRTPSYSYAIVTIPFWKNDGTLFAAPFEYGGNYPLFATQSEALAFSKNNVGPISFTFDNYKFGVNESPDPFQGTGRTDSDFPANASYQANMQKQVTFWMPGGLERAKGTTPPRSFATHYWVPNDGGAKHPHAPVWSQTIGDVVNGTRRYPYYTAAPNQSAHAQVWPFFTDMFKFDYPADAISGSGAGDLDSDGIIDIVDPDKDNDGYLDSVDADPLNPYVFTGDADGDGTDTLLDPDDTDSSVGLYTSSADFTLQYDYYYIRTNMASAYQNAIIDVEANGDTKDNFITGGLSYSKRRTSGAYSYFAGISLPAQTQGAKVILNTNSTNYTYLLQAGMEFINPQNIPNAGNNVYPDVNFSLDVLGFQRYAVAAGIMSSSKSFYTALHVPYLDNSGAIIANPMSHKGYYPLFRSQAEADSWGLNSASSTSVVLIVAGGHNQLGGQIFYNTDGTTRTSYNYQDANTNSVHDINITETFWMPGGHTTATAITPLDAWRTHIWTPSTQAHPGFPVYAACYVSTERDAAHGIPTSERGLARWTLDGKDRATRQPDGSLLVPRIGLVDWATNTQE
jgi:hypothetical protein